MTIQYLNPPDIHAPVGAYSHTASVPQGTEMIFVSGQVGMRADGSVPEAFAEQAELVFQNLRSCLAAHGLGMEAVVKLTSYLLPGQDIQLMREIRQRYLRGHRPASTLVYVPLLASPSFLLEVEATAAKRLAAGKPSDPGVEPPA